MRATSEGLLNEQAFKKVNIPETRKALLEILVGEDNEIFLNYLNENCYNLHYAAMPGAKPYSFGLGNLWRIAMRHRFPNPKE